MYGRTQFCIYASDVEIVAAPLNACANLCVAAGLPYSFDPLQEQETVLQKRPDRLWVPQPFIQWLKRPECEVHHSPPLVLRLRMRELYLCCPYVLSWSAQGQLCIAVFYSVDINIV
jgi:hypothetical protein